MIAQPIGGPIARPGRTDVRTNELTKKVGSYMRKSSPKSTRETPEAMTK